MKTFSFLASFAEVELEELGEKASEMLPLALFDLNALEKSFFLALLLLLSVNEELKALKLSKMLELEGKMVFKLNPVFPLIFSAGSIALVSNEVMIFIKLPSDGIVGNKLELCLKLDGLEIGLFRIAPTSGSNSESP